MLRELASEQVRKRVVAYVARYGPCPGIQVIEALKKTAPPSQIQRAIFECISGQEVKVEETLRLSLTNEQIEQQVLRVITKKGRKPCRSSDVFFALPDLSRDRVRQAILRCLDRGVVEFGLEFELRLRGSKKKKK